MNEKMSVVYNKHTGHVLAAVTGVANPDADFKVEELALGGLLIRGISGKTDQNDPKGNERFEVLPGELVVKPFDLDQSVLVDPRAFILENDQLVQIPTAATPKIKKVEVTSNHVKVEMMAAVAAEAKVWIQIDGGNLSEPRTEQGKILVGESIAGFDIQTLDPDTYFILTLVVDREPCAQNVTVS